MTAPPFRARRSASWLRRGGGALIVSAAVHAAAAATIGGVLGAGWSGLAPAAPAPRETLDVDLAPWPEQTPPSATAKAAPRRPSVVRAPRRGNASPTPVAPAAEALPARFALSAGTVASGPALSAAPTGDPAGPATDGTPVGEGEVNVPARLLAASPLIYPPVARQAEVEIDFPIEIVVGAGGRVLSARALRHAGYGLDEAALRAIRAYRFSPAIRAGRPVSVRMRWIVQFRLR